MSDLAFTLTVFGVLFVLLLSFSIYVQRPRFGNASPQSIEVVVYGWPSAKAGARLSTAAEPLKTTYDPAAHALHILLPDVAGKAELRLLGETAR